MRQQLRLPSILWSVSIRYQFSMSERRDCRSAVEGENASSVDGRNPPPNEPGRTIELTRLLLSLLPLLSTCHSCPGGHGRTRVSHSLRRPKAIISCQKTATADLEGVLKRDVFCYGFIQFQCACT